MIIGSGIGLLTQWWKAPKDSAHENVIPFIKRLDTTQTYRSQDNLRHMRLYGNYDMVGLNAYSYNHIDSASVTNRVTLNVVQSMVDTVVSKITKNRPKPMFLTDGGDWSLQLKAKKLTKFCEGVFQSCGLYEQAPQVFQDSCIFGTGAIKFFIENNQIKSERVFIDELVVDDTECFYSKPRQMHQTKFIHKDILVAKYPDLMLKIEQASASSDNYTTDRSHNKDLIRVIESWHIPSGDVVDSKGKPIDHDGRHTITISTCTLVDEPYTKTYFPFIFFRWNVRPVGFFGQGIAEQLVGIQLEINKILRTIQVSMHLTSIPKVFVEASSKVVTAHLNNKIGGIIKYAGTKPSYESVGSVSPELFMHLDRLYTRAYETIGVSQLSAQSQKPTGLDSGKAIRTFNDLETERFMSVAQRFERTFIDAAKIVVDMAKDLYKDLGKLDVKVKGRKFLETIKWEDVDMEEDKYLLDVFPISALSSTPTGRLQDVQDLINLGVVSKEQAVKLLDFPDLESAYNLLNASLDDIERMIERMIVEGIYETPEPYQNLEMGLRMVQQAYLYYKSQNCDEDRLELLRRWMEDCQGMLKMQQQVLPTQQQQVQQFSQAGQDEAAANVVKQMEGQANPLVEQALPLQQPPQ